MYCDKNVPQMKSPDAAPCVIPVARLWRGVPGVGRVVGHPPGAALQPRGAADAGAAAALSTERALGQSRAAPLQIRGRGGGCVKVGSTKIRILSALANLLKYFWGR